MNNVAYRLLALGARAECRTEHYESLARAAKQLTGSTGWRGVPALAEAQGVAPLFYRHLQAAGVRPPVAVRRALQGLYLRHRRANQVRMAVLRDLLDALDGAGVQVLVLKGGALAHLLYEEPGLRPMSDLDILVAESQLWLAQDLLAGLGFDVPPPSG